MIASQSGFRFSLRFLLFPIMFGTGIIAVMIPSGKFDQLSATSLRDDKIDAVKALLKAQSDAWNKGDIEGFMAGYWKSPELTFISGGDVTKGWDATIQRYKKRYQGEGKEMGQLTFSDVEVTIEKDDLAIVRGRWDLKFTKSNDKPGGRYTLLVRKLPEGWRVTYDHTSSDDKK
jgi:beta-aspartyl-peptidase (threonine type)